MPNRLVNKAIKTYLILKANFHKTAFADQERIAMDLVAKCKNTIFGKKYGFANIKSIKDFQNQIPIHHYKDFEQRIMYMLKWEKNVSYPGKIDRFATSSWTTWGNAKFIPITKDNLKSSHFKWGMDLISAYINNNPKTQFFKGKSLVIGGWFTKNPYTWEDNVWFISAILQKTAPWIGQYFREPSLEISYIENREEKMQNIIESTINKNITAISWQPSRWVNLLHKILEYTGKKNILEVWPNFEFFFRWGMSIDLYKHQLNALFPSDKVKYYQVYNASEWFFAFQDRNSVDDMLLCINHGVFYEFIPLEEYGKADPTVLTLKEVEINKTYVIMITNNSWLRRYILGDTIKFTSINPRRIKITWRTKYYIDLVGECVTADYTDRALLEACKKTNTIATDCTCAPLIYTSWSFRWSYERVIEFTKSPQDSKEFARILDQELCNIHSYYFDERHDTKVIWMPIVHIVPQWTFYKWLKSKNKLGWQHKVPKLSNDRVVLDDLLSLIAN